MSNEESPKLNDAVLNGCKPDAIAARIGGAGVAKTTPGEVETFVRAVLCNALAYRIAYRMHHGDRG